MAADLMTVGQVAAEYRVDEATVRRWIRDGRVPFVLVGPSRLKRIERAAVATEVPAGTAPARDSAKGAEDATNRRKAASRR